MRPREVFLGIDVGTTGVKVLAVEEGSVLAEAMEEYPTSQPRPLWVEQEPDAWWRATVRALRRVWERVSPTWVAGVGLSGQMHGLVALDGEGRVVRPCILWNDQRTAPQCRQIQARLGEETILALTGNAMLPGFTLPKLLWVAQHEPHLFARIATVMLPKDYVRTRLTDQLFSDVTDASGTGAFDVAGRTWSWAMLDSLELPRGWWPQTLESCAVAGAVCPRAARETGLVQGTPVVAGAGDQAAQALGVGLVGEGPVGITLGTSGVVFAVTARFRPEPRGRLHAFCHAVPGMWHVMGVMLSAGGSLQWWHEVTAVSYETLMEEAAQVEPGCQGVVFLPYLSGERTPYADPTARGVFFGLATCHSRAHMTRAVLEGVAFGLKDCLDLVEALGIPLAEARLSGGGARSALWRQIVADVLGRNVWIPQVTSGAAFGAAMLAAVGAGRYGTVQEAAGLWVRESQTVEPRSGPSAAHARIFRDLYQALRPLYDALAEATAQ